MRDSVAGRDEAKALANYGLLTLKPVLILINLDEEDIAKEAEIEGDYLGRYGSGSTFVGAMCARLAAELGELEPEEADEFRREMGATEPAAARILARTQEVLGLVTFYTPVGTECRAWAARAGAPAAEAAGRIHTDMDRGFSRAAARGWARACSRVRAAAN